MNIQNSTLDTLDLSLLSTCIVEDEFRKYFLDISGKEHYRLLAYLSTLYSNSTLLDIGTYKGCSALALAYNPSNTIISFDIKNNRTITNYPVNIQFNTADILDKSYNDTILKSPVILLDTFHDGTFEHQFMNHLHAIEWKGTLVLDDIFLNPQMISFWNSIINQKEDVTKIGHFSGTGIVTIS